VVLADCQASFNKFQVFFLNTKVSGLEHTRVTNTLHGSSNGSNLFAHYFPTYSLNCFFVIDFLIYLSYFKYIKLFAMFDFI
jgi:hypothetical protein